LAGSDTDDLKRVAREQIAADPMLAAVFDVWEKKRGTRFAPHPSEIDAFALPPSVLPRIVLVDVIDGGARFRFRLVGTGVAFSSGADYTGKYVDEALSGDAQAAVLHHYRSVVREKRPAYAVAEVLLSDGHSVRNCRVAMPLSCDGVNVHRLLLISRTTSDWMLRVELQNLERDDPDRETIRTFTVL
jgi:hypothetical protein